MKRVPIVLVALSAIVLLGSARAYAGSDGKSVFLAKCQGCHSLSSEGIASREFPTPASVDWSRFCRQCTPDLSDVGRRREADWLKAYIRNEKKGRNGLKHNELPIGRDLIMKLDASDVPMTGTLSDEDLDALVQWLTTLKTAPAAAPAGSATSKPAEITPTNPPSVALPREDAGDVLRSARTVAVIGQTGKQMMNRAIWNPDGERAREKVAAVLSEWGRYTVVEHVEDADLVVVVTEFQKNINLLRRANLIAEMRVYRGGQPPSAETPTVWSGDAAEGFSQPATKVAEKFRDFVTGLLPRQP